MTVRINADGTTATEFSIGIGGPTIRQGSATPTSNLGRDGDIYLRNGANPMQFRKADGAWLPLHQSTNFVRTTSPQGSAATISEIASYHGVVAGTNTETQLTLPTGFAGKQLIIKDEIGGGNITISPSGADEIEGGSELVITAPHGAVTAIFHNKWRVIRIIGGSVV